MNKENVCEALAFVQKPNTNLRKGFARDTTSHTSVEFPACVIQIAVEKDVYPELPLIFRIHCE